MNLYSQGIDPQLDLADIQSISERISRLLQIPVHPRHPYIGELVYTVFSGSHQDAINKCLKNQQPGQVWEVAYLPIDPADLGRSYKDVIRINSQSGKGGVAYIIEQELGIKLSREEQMAFASRVQKVAEQSGTEMSREAVIELFKQWMAVSNRRNSHTDWTAKGSNRRAEGSKNTAYSRPVQSETYMPGI